ncbi:MAG: hypothetical protein MSH21_07780 [Clostridium sp.]|nr:hypothetical protein [Clostridium sp.]
MEQDYEAGDVYNVSITGLGDGKDVSYSVNFFELGKISKPAAVKIKNANVKKNKVTVYFKKVNNASGYEVRYSKDSKFKKNVKKKLVSSKVSKTTITLKKSYKKCFIRMRAYTKKNGKKIYGNWGNAFAISKC